MKIYISHITLLPCLLCMPVSLPVSAQEIPLPPVTPGPIESDSQEPPRTERIPDEDQQIGGFPEHESPSGENTPVNTGDPANSIEEITQSEAVLVDAECRRIGGKLGSVSYEDCRDLNLGFTGRRSVKNAPLLFKEYPPLETRDPLGRVLLLGGVHGDEYSSVSIIFKWLRTLDAYHSGLFHWHIVPLVNPDGLLRDGSTRTNANGVDINRNFPLPEWEETALEYWINRTGRNDRKYPGPNAVSEPETAFIVDKINKFRPDVIISVHAPHGIVDYDGPEDGPYKLGRLHLNLLGTYPGSLGNYAGIQREIPVVTIELPYAGIMPTAEEIADIWRDLVRWLINNVPGVSQDNPDQETDPS